MKNSLFILFFAIVAASAAEVKVLTIGNSFSWSVAKDLREIAKIHGDDLKLSFANHGGCSIQRHWQYICAEEADPQVKHYNHNGIKVKLREKLAAEKWDIVTLQQVSSLSWVKGSFYPELDKLVAYIKKHAPQAEIVFQQTWAYRNDDPRLKKWGGQRAMFNGIFRNYREASKKFGCRVIPVGIAVELARAAQPVKFQPVAQTVIDAARKNPGTPISQPGSLFVGWCWRKNKKNILTLRRDSTHLNNRGKYLQSCVWYGFLFKKSPLDIRHQGFRLSAADAAMLRKCAAEALKQYKQR